MTKEMTVGEGKLPAGSFAMEPVHLRLAGICREAIGAGKFEAGERFPSERELAERYEVSRATANKVISTLVTEGLLELRKGLGARVRERRTLFASLGGMESFTAHVRGQGMGASTEVLGFRNVSGEGVPDEVREGLGVEGDDGVVYLERLRLADGVPMILEFRWVRGSMAPGLARGDVEGSFYGMLEEKFGLRMTGERHTISAVLLEGENADRLGGAEVALCVEGAGFVRGDEALWYQRLYYRGDRYRLHNATGVGADAGIELKMG